MTFMEKFLYISTILAEIIYSNCQLIHMSYKTAIVVQLLLGATESDKEMRYE